MRIVVVVSDCIMSIDGVAKKIDFSNIFDKNIHAIQWYGEYGEIEIKDSLTGKIIENKEIHSIDFLRQAIDAWNNSTIID